jgi:hypothetical protein
MQPNPFTAAPEMGASGAAAPRPRDMVGALVAYAPLGFTAAGAPGNTTGVGNSPPRSRVTADLYVLDTGGQWIQFGGSPEWDQQPTPHYLMGVGPMRFSGVWVSNSTIVNALAPGGQPMVGQMILGRIVRSEIGNKPFNLQTPTPEDIARATQIWSALQMGSVRYNEPQPIPGAPVPQPKQQPGPSGPLQQVAYPQPQTAPVYAAPQPQGYAPTYAPPPAPAYQPPSTVPAPQAAPVAPAGPTPPGWDPAVFASLPDFQKQQVWASLQQQQAPAPVPAPQGTPNPF